MADHGLKDFFVCLLAVRSPKECSVFSCEICQGLGYLCICVLCVVYEVGIKLAGFKKTLDFVRILGWSCFFDSLDLFSVADLEKIVPNHDTDVGPKVYFSLLRVRPPVGG